MRLALRKKFEFPIQWTSPGGKAEAGLGLDISSSGMQIEIQKGLRIGDSLVVDLVLPGESRRIRLSSRVVRESKLPELVRAKRPGIRRYGIQFLALDAATHAYLQNYLTRSLLPML